MANTNIGCRPGTLMADNIIEIQINQARDVYSKVEHVQGPDFNKRQNQVKVYLHRGKSPVSKKT